jgi:hypothetical protein
VEIFREPLGGFGDRAKRERDRSEETQVARGSLTFGLVFRRRSERSSRVSRPSASHVDRGFPKDKGLGRSGIGR